MPNNCVTKPIAIALTLLLFTGCSPSLQETEKQPITPPSISDDTNTTSAGDDIFSGKSFGDLVYLSWQEVPDKNYKIYRQNPTYQQTPTLHARVNSGITSFKDRNLILGENYSYKLEACTSSTECTSLGNTITLSTNSLKRPETTTTITDASYDATNNEILISWQDVPSAYKYNLWKTVLTGNLGDTETLIDSSIIGTVYHDPSPDDNSRYLYRVTACSSDNKCSGHSNQFAIALGVNIIADPVLTKDTTNDRNIDLAWSPVQLAKKYEISRNYNDTGYLLIATSSFPKFSDPVASSVGGTFRYNIRACNEIWGCSNYVETKLHTMVAASSTNKSAANYSNTTTLVLPNIDIDLPEPQVLFSNRKVFLFWKKTDEGNTSSYFKVRIGNRETHILSQDQKMLELDYSPGTSIKLLKCSNKLLVCTKGSSLIAQETDIPLGNSQTPILTASLPEIIGLSWSSDLSEDFIVTYRQDKFNQILQPTSASAPQKYTLIDSLEQNTTYTFRAINCRTSSWSNIYYCKSASQPLQALVPQYDPSIDMRVIKTSWDNGHTPIISFDLLDTKYLNTNTDSSTDNKDYRLVLSRDCIGLLCFDLTHDISMMLETHDFEQQQVLFIDQNIDQLLPIDWQNDNSRLELHYSLWLCWNDSIKCSQSYSVIVERTKPDNYIMAFNPARLGIENTLRLALAHRPIITEQVELQLGRNYRNSINSDPNDSMTEFSSYTGQINFDSQTALFSRVKPFAQSRLRYLEDTQITSLLRTEKSEINGAANIIKQDELADLTVEGVERLIMLTDQQLCVQYINSTIGCSGDTSLSSANISDSQGSRHLALLRDYLSTPIEPIKYLSNCDNGNSPAILSGIPNNIVSMGDQLCLIHSDGIPYCIQQQQYLCPLISLVELDPIESDNQSNHICVLGKYNRFPYCWGELGGAIPFIPTSSESIIDQPKATHFFSTSSNYPQLDSIYTGKDFTCLSYKNDEYCYSDRYKWQKEGLPVAISFPHPSYVTQDRAAYKSLMCWLQTDTSSSYIHCINGGTNSKFSLPEATKVKNSTLDVFLLARVPTTLSSKARLHISESTICVFDQPNLWCAGDTGYFDYNYDSSKVHTLRTIELPFYQPYDFAMSSKGKFCLSYGTSKRLFCWRLGNQSTPLTTPQSYWPLFTNAQPQLVALTNDYSCATAGSSLGCWGKANNPVVTINTDATDTTNLVKAKFELIDTGDVLQDLQLGKRTACYQQEQQHQWYCWGKIGHMTELTAQTDERYDQVSLEDAVPINFESGIKTIALAAEHDVICLLDNQRQVRCTNIQSSLADDHQQETTSFTTIKNTKSEPFKAEGGIQIIGDSLCAIGQDGDSYSVFCTDQLTDATGELKYSPAKAIIKQVSKNTLLSSGKNQNLKSSSLLALDKQRQTLNGFVDNNPIKPVSIIGEIRQLSIWPAQQPLALLLTKAGDIIWQNIVTRPDNGTISSLSKIDQLSVGINNICVTSETMVLCGGDNSFGKSGLIE